MTNHIHPLLTAWFGELGTADLPNSDRTNLWFGEDIAPKQQLLDRFQEDYHKAIQGALSHWAATPRGRLALIILIDQFSRVCYDHSKDAFAYDEQAQQLCLEGVQQQMDQALTLIERVFFYMPLVHAESVPLQEHSIQLYESLTALSMIETKQVYQLFLAYAYAHFKVIKTFGRFPQRNEILNRPSTEAELTFLKRS